MQYNFQMPNSPEEYTIQMPDIAINTINFSELEYQTISKMFVEYLALYHKDKFTDFVKHDGVIMFEELMAYMGHLLSNRQDLQANESFLPTARTEFAVDQHLKVLNNKLQRQTPASIEVTLETETPIATAINIAAGTSFNVFSADGERLTYEIFKAPGNWEDAVQLFPGITSTIAYGVEGVFVDPLEYVAEGIENEEFVIYDDNILEEPFVIDITIGSIKNRWIKVDNIEKYDADDKVYEIIFTIDGALIRFGNNLHGSKLPEGSLISIKYRTGGGVRGRIPAKVIDEFRDITVSSNLGSIQVHFINYVTSTGGQDTESLDNAKKRASAESFTLESAITSKDYIIISKNFNHPVYGSVEKASATIRSGVDYNIDTLIDELRAQDSSGEFVLNDDEVKQLLLNKYVNKNLIEVYILTAGSEGLAKPSEWLKKGLKNHLESIGPITDEVKIHDGSFKNVNLEMDVVMDYNSDITLVKNEVEEAVNNFFSIDNFEIGEGFYISQFHSSLQSVDGVYQIRIKNPNYDIVPTTDVTSSQDDEIGMSEIIKLESSIIKYYRKTS